MTEAHLMSRLPMVILLQLCCVAFTKNHNNQICKTFYTQHQQAHQIQKTMEIMTQEVQTNDLKEAFNTLIPDSIGKELEKACESIYLPHNVLEK
jgi:small subunit ribosomal protein S3Ae